MTNARISSFTLLSGLGWSVDFFIYNFLSYLGLSYFLANLIGATTAVSFVFISSRKWIFRNHVGSLRVAIVKYVAWNIFAITVASYSIALLISLIEATDFNDVAPLLGEGVARLIDERGVISNLAKIMVTPFTMYANFIAMGYISERRLYFY